MHFTAGAAEHNAPHRINMTAYMWIDTDGACWSAEGRMCPPLPPPRCHVTAATADTWMSSLDPLGERRMKISCSRWLFSIFYGRKVTSWVDVLFGKSADSWHKPRTPRDVSPRFIIPCNIWVVTTVCICRFFPMFLNLFLWIYFLEK